MRWTRPRIPRTHGPGGIRHAAELRTVTAPTPQRSACRRVHLRSVRRASIPGDPGQPRGLGFRSNREVRSEMSPVIYRPAGSGDPEPERPARVSIAGPGIPTAASFVDETGAPIEPEPSVVDLDEDPEIDDDELVAEAADDLVDDGESSPAGPRRERAVDDDDDLADQIAPGVAADRPTSQRRPPLQRRRRRLLGWGSDPSPAPEPEPEPEATRSPAEPPPVAPPPSAGRGPSAE